VVAVAGAAALAVVAGTLAVEELEVLLLDPHPAITIATRGTATVNLFTETSGGCCTHTLVLTTGERQTGKPQGPAAVARRDSDLTHSFPGRCSYLLGVSLIAAAHWDG
jgi:hypothetical protein